jgi:hypothetical protein
MMRIPYWVNEAAYGRRVAILHFPAGNLPIARPASLSSAIMTFIGAALCSQFIFALTFNSKDRIYHCCNVGLFFCPIRQTRSYLERADGRQFSMLHRQWSSFFPAQRYLIGRAPTTGAN